MNSKCGEMGTGRAFPWQEGDSDKTGKLSGPDRPQQLLFRGLNVVLNYEAHIYWMWVLLLSISQG